MTYAEYDAIKVISESPHGKSLVGINDCTHSNTDKRRPFLSKNSLLVCGTLFLVLALLFGLSGCGTELSAQQISSNTIENCTTLQTFRATQTGQEVIEVTGGSNPGNFTLLSNSAGTSNSLAREMQYTSDISMYISGVEGKQNGSGDIYIMGGWIYMKVSVPGEGVQWLKQKLSDDIWLSENQVAQQAQILRTSHNPIKLGSEEVNGVDCYIIQVTPEINTLIKSGLAEQLSEYGDVKNLDWGQVVKYNSAKVWIAKDKYLPTKFYWDISLEILPQELGKTTNYFDKIAINITFQMKFYDYNQPVVIQLPPEAQNAIEQPPS